MSRNTDEICEGRREDIQKLTDFLLEYAITLMASGSYTARVVRNVTRIAKTFGYDADMTIFQKNITITVTCPDDYSIRRTYVRRLRVTPLSFRRVSELSALSWRAYDEDISLKDLEEAYDRIISAPPADWRLVLVSASAANAAFCKLFGGDAGSAAAVFAATLIAFSVKTFLLFLRFDVRAVFVICAFIASMTAAGGAYLGVTKTGDIAVAVSVLFLIPGVHLINSVVDILDGHVLIGVSRAINTGIIIICIALGLYMTLSFTKTGIL